MKTIVKKSIRTIPALVVLASLSFGGVAYAADTPQMALPSATQASVGAQVNINTADANQIAGKVSGIGQKRAEAIVAYRTEHGAFKSFDDLALVKGIGDSYVSTHSDALKQAFTLS
jgi:competence protein ComEA